MTLPQELLDEILGYLHPVDKQSFSLVSRSWLECSRRRYFAVITIKTDGYEKFLDTFSPTNTGLLRHVRTLTYFLPGQSRDPHPDRAIYALQDYLPSLYQLQTLTFSNMKIEPTIPERLDLFSGFQHTLSSLYLMEVSFTWGTFVSLVGHFTNLRNLEIASVELFQEDGQPVPQPSRALRGRLHIWADRSTSTPACNVVAVANRLAELQLEYEVLVLGGEYGTRIISAVQQSVKVLIMTRGHFLARLDTPLDLSHCPNLQEIHIRTTNPDERDVALISSITSTNLRKIFFFSISWDLLLSNPLWPHFDDLVCRLMDKLSLVGYPHTLEVEILVLRWVDSRALPHVWKFLPKFRRKGRVRILKGTSGGCLLL